MSEAKCPVSGSTGKCPVSFSSATAAATSYPNAAKTNKDGVVTALNGKRSSDGMGLPASMSQATIDMIVATAPAVAPKMLDITKCFYTKVLGKPPELKQHFNTAVRTIQYNTIQFNAMQYNTIRRKRQSGIETCLAQNRIDKCGSIGYSSVESNI